MSSAQRAKKAESYDRAKSVVSAVDKEGSVLDTTELKSVVSAVDKEGSVLTTTELSLSSVQWTKKAVS